MPDVVPLRPDSTRWEPDENLIEAAMSGRLRGRTLPEADRAWLVAVLTHRGITAEIIAAWLGISRRTVKTERGKAVAVLTAQLLAKQAGRGRTVPTPAAVAQLLNDNQVLRERSGRLIEQLAEMRRRCDEPCPPSVIILRPAHAPRRRRVVDATLPLFEVEGA